MQPDGANEVLDRLVSQGLPFNKVLVPHGDSTHVGAYTFGDPTKQPLLLIHGSPGDWSAWENIIANEGINENCFIVAIDRAGYGLTTLPAQASLKMQASAVSAVIESLKLSDIAIVGHSYGGAVVEQLLVDNQASFKLALLVAPTVSPVDMAPRWYNKLAGNRLIKKILPKDLLTSNIEMIALPIGLRNLESRLAEVSVPIIYMQGKDDILVPIESVDYYKSVAPNTVEYIILENKNHFIPWTDPGLINNILIKHLTE